MKLEEQLEILIKSRFPLINLITREEDRIIKILAVLFVMRSLFDSQRDQIQKIEKWTEEVNTIPTSAPKDDDRGYHLSPEGGGNGKEAS